MKVEIKDSRLKHIIESAENVFFEKGFAWTSISDICKSANCSRTTLYSHFENKENVYLAVINASFEDFLNYFTNIDVSGQNGIDQMLRYAKGYISYSKNRPKNYLMILEFYALLKSVKNEEFKSDIDMSLANCTFFPRVEKKAEMPATFLVKIIQKGQTDQSITDQEPAETLFLNVWAYLIGCSNLLNFSNSSSASHILGLRMKATESNILNTIRKMLS